MPLLGEIMVMFTAETAGFNAGAGLVVAALAGIGVAIGETVHQAGDFQAGITNLATAAGESTNNLGMVGDGIKKVAVDTGTSTKSLIDAMFMIESSGAHGSAGLNELSIAARGAKTDNADLMTVSKALTGVLAGWPQTANGAAGGMNELIVAASEGKMHLQDLSKAMSSVIPIATNAGVSFADVGAAVAMMTNKNTTAQKASQWLAFALRSMSAPSGVAQKAMKSVGISAQDLKDTLSTKGLGAAIDMVTTAVGKKFPKGSIEATTALKNIMGGANGLNVALLLGGKNLSTYEEDVRKIAAAARDGGQSVEGWSTVQGNFNTKMSQAQAAMEVLGIDIGTKLLPVLSQLLGAVTPLIMRFADWITKGDGIQKFLNDTSPLALLLKGGIIALAGAIGGVLVFALVAMAVAAWAAIVPMLPFIAIGALVALAVVGIVLAIQHWGEIMHWIGGVFSAVGAQLRESATKVKNDVGGIFNALGTQMRESATKVKNDVGGIFNALGTELRTSATKVKNDVGGAFDALGTQMRESATKTKNDVGNIMSGLGTAAHNAGQSIVDAGKWMYDHNTYWKTACDDMGKSFDALGTQMRGSATKVKNDVGRIFDDMGTQLTQSSTKTHNDVGAQFSDMGTQMRQSSTKTGNDVGNIFSALGTHVSQAVNTMRDNSGAGFSSLGSQARGVMTALRVDVLDNIGRAVGGFMSQMGSLVSGVAGKLGQLAGNFFSTMGSLASQAFAWGSNIIGNLIGGISSRLGELAGVVGQAAGQLASILGFHSPAKEGPGRDADQWMPNLIKMMQAGLIAGEPTIKNAAIQVASMFSPMIDVHSSGSVGSSSSSGQGNGTQTIIIQMDGRDVAKALGPHLTNEIRLVAQVRR